MIDGYVVRVCIRSPISRNSNVMHQSAQMWIASCLELETFGFVHGITFASVILNCYHLLTADLRRAHD